MKRHPGLVPLSREHHDGLLLATRLQQGSAALLRLWSHDAAWQAEFVTRFFDDHLAAHFATEEETLFPLAADVPALAPTVAELTAEHAELRALAERLRRAAGAERDEALVRFGSILERHIRTEERVLFPGCEDNLAPADLERIGGLIGLRHGGTT